jgi:hypothetical protein
MTTTNQIKTIAADFLRLLVTAPELFARWQAETSQAARADIVRNALGLAQLSVSEVEQMAAYAQPWAVNAAARPSGLPTYAITLTQSTALGATA